MFKRKSIKLDFQASGCCCMPEGFPSWLVVIELISYGCYTVRKLSLTAITMEEL